MHLPGLISFDPVTGNMVVVFDRQHLIWFGSNAFALQPSAAAAGWYFTDFENDNVWYIPGAGQPEAGILESNIPPGLSMLAYNDTDDFLYSVNWTGGWPFGGDNSVYRIEGNGTAVAIAMGTPGTNDFSSIAMSKGGPFGNHLYATDSAGGRIVRLENTEGVWSVVPVITGLPTPSFLKFSPTTGEMIVVCNGGENVLWVGTTVPAELENLVMNVIGPKIVNPGQEATFLVRYLNGMDKAAENVVITLDIPRTFNYLTSTGNGIYRDDGNKHEVFWRLGNLEPDKNGELAVKMFVPWGLPNFQVDLLAEIGAQNVPSRIDVDFYLNFTQATITSQKELTEAEINIRLSSDSELNELFQYALGLGYFYDKQALLTHLSDGSFYLTIFMLDPKDFGPVLLISNGERAIIQKQQGNKYVLMDKKGGFSIDSSDHSRLSWGEWAESHSLSFTDCMWNCVIEKDPIGLGGLILKRGWSAVSSGINCYICYQTGGYIRCTACLYNL